MDMFRDRKGRPLSIQEAEDLLRSKDKRTVGNTQVGESRVSTVLLVVPHICYDPECQHPDAPACALFESMIFGGDWDGRIYRWHTLKEAIDGHAATVARVRAKCESSS